MQKRLSARLAAPLLAALLAVLPLHLRWDNRQKSESSTSSLPKVGQMAPDFTLNYFDGND